MMSARFSGFAVGSLLFSASLAAQAEPMDLAIERLVANGSSCLSADGAGRFEPTSAQDCRPDNLAFKRLVNQLGFALAPTAMHSARTTGFGGFNVAFEASYTSISSDADYWKRGTQGAPDPSTKQAATSNQSPASLLQQYSLKLRKGFGYGFEISGVVGFLPQTSLINGGADVRLAVLEGFRTGVLGILPDLAVGGGVRTITGTPELAAHDRRRRRANFEAAGDRRQLGADAVARLSIPVDFRRFGAGRSDAGHQRARRLQLRRAETCRATRTRAKTHTNPNGNVSNVYDGQPICRGGSPRDFNNNAVFEPVRVASPAAAFRAELSL